MSDTTESPRRDEEVLREMERVCEEMVEAGLLSRHVNSEGEVEYSLTAEGEAQAAAQAEAEARTNIIEPREFEDYCDEF